MKRFQLTLLKTLGIAAIVIAVVLRHPSAAYACTATPEGVPPPTREEQINAADYIFDGTVTAVELVDGYMEVATIEVTQYLKGSGPARVRLGRFGPSSMCLTTVGVGRRGLFLASGDPAGELYASYFGGGFPVWPVNASAEIIGIVGQAVVTAIPVTDSASEDAITITPTATITQEPEVTQIAEIEPSGQESAEAPAPTADNSSALPPWAATALYPVMWVIGFVMGACFVRLMQWMRSRP